MAQPNTWAAEQEHMNSADPMTVKVEFPPIPLASGVVFMGTDGSEHVAQRASFVMHGEDGSCIEIPLDFRFGGWWAPVV